MTSRSKHPKRREPESDSMEALKPLVVLVLFGTILYGAYTVVQKGPSSAETSATTMAPQFVPGTAATPPQVEVAPPAAPAAPAAHAAPAAATVASSVPVLPAPAPPAAGSPPAATPTAGGSVPPAAAVAGASATPATPAPTYLEAVSAAPPVADQVPARPTDPATRPDRYAALPTPTVPPAALPPSMPPAASAVKSPAMSAAFTSAWADAHDKLAAGRYAEALTALSVWYDDPSLGLEEGQRLEDLLGQLAGTVIYSQQDLLHPPHVVAPGETLPAIAAPLGVPWQLLGKINGIGDPAQLVPGEHLKVLRGPFDGVVSISRRRLGLQLAGSYAGSFPAVVGREFLARVGASLAVVDIRRGAAGPNPGRRAIVLADGMVIEAVDDPSTVTDNAPATSLVMSERDLDDLIDILGPGSRVLVRQ